MKIFSTSRANLWRYTGWITVAIAAVLYYGRYSKTPVNLVVYSKGAECLWDGQPFHQCSPENTYPPAVSLLMLPFVPLSPEMRLFVWYVISIAATIGCVGLCEALIRRLYPSAADEPQFVWIRLLTILFALKFILVVLNYQAYDTIVLCVMLLGLWTLINRRPVTAGGLLALATAVKATPLIVLPYLVLKRRFVTAAVFVGVLVVLCLLPDMLNALRGMRSDYFESWIAQIVGPAFTPGGHSTQWFWHGWMGQTLDNLSLRGVLNRLVREPVAGMSPRQILIAVYVVVIAVIAALMLRSPRGDENVAADGAVLMIGMLALSPISSRYHFIVLMLPYAVVIAAGVCDERIRRLALWTLVASFILVTGTSNDVTGQTLAEFAHAHGFMLIGSLILLVPLAVIIAPRRRLSPAREKEIARSGSAATRPVRTH